MMLPDPTYIATLLARQLQQELTPEEAIELQTALESLEAYPEFKQELLNEEVVWQWYLEEERFREQRYKEKVLARIHAAIDLQQVPVSVQRIPFFKTSWFRYAAIFLLMAGVTSLIYTLNRRSSTAIAPVYTNIQPGKTGAILTLADGKQVSLDTIISGVVALQGGVTAKVLDGRLLYEGTSKDGVYNTMSTPSGRQYPLTLPDGTKVWLNAESSIRYPTVFSGNERRVYITGEVYFEVAKNAAKPFHVNMRDGVGIVVLGTAFNVNAYENEGSIHATLLEGGIRVSVPAANSSKQVKQVDLVPGQAARIISLAGGSDIQVRSDANIEKMMAWKNGLFNFNDLPFDEIMRQLERWYGIKVVYENNVIPNKRLIGKMTMGVPLLGLLKNLEKFGVRYTLDGSTLIIGGP